MRYPYLSSAVTAMHRRLPPLRWQWQETRVTWALCWGALWSSSLTRHLIGWATSASWSFLSVSQKSIPKSQETLKWQKKLCVCFLCCFDCIEFFRYLRCPGCNPVAKYISSLDNKFNSIFLDAGWRDVFGRLEAPTSGLIQILTMNSLWMASQLD